MSEAVNKLIWTPQDLANYLQVSLAWVYKRSAPSYTDPIPRCPGLGRIRFNTGSSAFQQWLERQVGKAV